MQPAAEGKVVRGFEDLHVGDRVRVELIHTDVEHGFVNFARVPLARFRREKIGDTVVFFGSARIAPDGPLGRFRQSGDVLSSWDLLFLPWSDGSLRAGLESNGCAEASVRHTQHARMPFELRILAPGWRRSDGSDVMLRCPGNPHHSRGSRLGDENLPLWSLSAGHFFRK
jgi:hypothetical protein